MKYIFMTGAPGSKWSMVNMDIYYCEGIDNSDHTEKRTYYHDAHGYNELRHVGAYFDPGMEFGKHFQFLTSYSKEDLEKEFDKPFSGEGVRIIKSHVFAYHLDFIRENWPDCPIVIVKRERDASLGWWVRCKEFRITYPDYSWFKNLDNMAREIDKEIDCVENWMHDNSDICEFMFDSNDLCNSLGIKPNDDRYVCYKMKDVEVTVANGKNRNRW